MTTSRVPTTRLITVALLTTGLAACTGTAPEPTATPTPTSAPSTADPSPTPTPSVDPALTEAEARILEAYRGYWAAKVASYANPAQPQDPNLAVFAVDTALAEAQSTIFQLQSDGVRLVGEPVLAPDVSDIVLGAEGSAQIRDCVDSSNWTPISVATGEPAAAPDQHSRVQAASTAYFFDGRWTIQSFVADRQSPC